MATVRRLVASSFCPLVIKVCCPSHIVVWEGSVWGALVRCPATGRLPSDTTGTTWSQVLSSGSLQQVCVSFFGAASTSALPYKADPGHLRHCPFWSPFSTHGSVRGWVFYPPHPRGFFVLLIMVIIITLMMTGKIVLNMIIVLVMMM